MNKKTILSLVLIAQLYGQISSANEVVISEQRLKKISQSEILFLQKNGALYLDENKVILNLQKLDSLLRNENNVKILADQAENSAAKFIPYGYTMETRTPEDLSDLVNSLSAKFVPYGNT